MAPKLREVLIIDDDKTANYLNERIVREMEITQSVKILRDGTDGLEYLKERCATPEAPTCPELIVLDHHMPTMDGLELMERLHQLGVIDNMRSVFLLLAIHTSPQDLRKFQRLGVQEFTNKPLSKQRLEEAFQKYWADDTVKDHTE